MINSLLILFSFQLLGEVASRLAGISVPGPVLGMVALALCCLRWPSLGDRLRPLTQLLLGNLSLFFVPAGVGVIAHLDLIGQAGLGLGVAIVVSTALAITAGAAAFAAVARMMGVGDDGP